MADFLIILALSIFGLVAHAARNKAWLEWVVRSIIAVTALLDLILLTDATSPYIQEPWQKGIMTGACTLTGLILLQLFRKSLSVTLTLLDVNVSLRLPILCLFRKYSPLQVFELERIFVPASLPHMAGAYIYITVLAYLLSAINLSEFKFPALPIPLPVTLDQLFSYNGLGLVMLSFCGVGVFVTRSPREAMQRLAWLKPTVLQIGIGIALIFMTFLYDAAWASFTHSNKDLASQLAMYNAGTFTAGGGFSASIILALATALCAGIGEETLIRGCLQPALGIFPAAFLHGILHGQFAHAPIFIVQVALWSTLMGVVRKYTNTTTTIIGHAGYNFVTTFLFAFNP